MSFKFEFEFMTSLAACLVKIQTNMAVIGKSFFWTMANASQKKTERHAQGVNYYLHIFNYFLWFLINFSIILMASKLSKIH